MTGDETSARGALNRDAMVALLADDPPLLEEYPNLHVQLQPNGIDVTVRSVASFPPEAGPGAIGVSDADRVLHEPT